MSSSPFRSVVIVGVMGLRLSPTLWNSLPRRLVESPPNQPRCLVGFWPLGNKKKTDSASIFVLGDQWAVILAACYQVGICRKPTRDQLALSNGSLPKAAYSDPMLIQNRCALDSNLEWNSQDCMSNSLSLYCTSGGNKDDWAMRVYTEKFIFPEGHVFSQKAE